jgi:lipid-A-disaccharide synthase
MNQLINKKSVMIIAGEASGDIHGSRLVMAIHKRDSAIFFYGIGGRALRDAGVKILVNAEELSVVGITEVFSKLTGILKGISAAKRSLKRMHPDLLILIDFPDFNLHVAAYAKKLKIPVLYYISPHYICRPSSVR